MCFITIKIELTAQVHIIAVSDAEKVFRKLSGRRTGRPALVWGSETLLRGPPVTTLQSHECLTGDSAEVRQAPTLCDLLAVTTMHNAFLI